MPGDGAVRDRSRASIREKLVSVVISISIDLHRNDKGHAFSRARGLCPVSYWGLAMAVKPSGR